MSRDRHGSASRLGADLEAEDASGQTALATAMHRGDREAMTRLHAAGATQPEGVTPSNSRDRMRQLAASVNKGIPMITVPDIACALDSIGIHLSGSAKSGPMTRTGW